MASPSGKGYYPDLEDSDDVSSMVAPALGILQMITGLVYDITAADTTRQHCRRFVPRASRSCHRFHPPPHHPVTHHCKHAEQVRVRVQARAFSGLKYRVPQKGACTKGIQSR